MKFAIIASAVACALIACTSALPTDNVSGEFVGDIDPDSLQGTQCTTAGGQVMMYVPGGEFAALSEQYMNSTLEATNCGRCIKATTSPTDGSAPLTAILTVIGACEGCSGNSFFSHPTTVARLGGAAARFVDDAKWSFVPCPGK